MNKEKAELYIRLFARAFLVAEIAHNGGAFGYEEDFKKICSYAKRLLDDIEEQAEEDLTPEEYKYYKEQTDNPNRADYE